MGTEQGCVVGEPALEEEDRLFEEVVLADEAGELLNEVECEESTKLANRDVDWSILYFEFDDNRICLSDEVDARQFQI